MPTTLQLADNDRILLEGLHRTRCQITSSGPTDDRALKMIDRMWKEAVRAVLGSNLHWAFIGSTAYAAADLNAIAAELFETAAKRFADSSYSDDDLCTFGMIRIDHLLYTRALESREEARGGAWLT